jgi:D-alanyl-D-alanine carboxypeptidase
MLNSFAGVDGIKTGYTRASGFNLVTSLHRGRLHLVGVVFGGSTAASRNSEMRILLTRALSRASPVKTRKPALIARLQSKPAPATRPVAKQTQVAVAAADAPVGGPPEAANPHTPQVAAVLRDMANASRQLTATAEPETPVHVFKVRHIPLVLKSEAAASPDETTDMEDMDTPRDAPRVGRGTAERTDLGRFNTDRQSPVQAFAGFDPEASDQTLVAKSAPPVGRPSIAGGQIEMLGAADRATNDGNAAETRATPIAFAPPDMMRGRAPSTLDAQSRSLQASPEPQGAAEQASTVPAAAAPANSTPAGRYEVQIGAYGSIAEAQRALTNVQDRAGKLLAGIASVTHPAMKNGHQIFRARFAGFNAERANSACTALRREGVDCFVMAGD